MNNEFLENLKTLYKKYLEASRTNVPASTQELERCAEQWLSAYNTAYSATTSDSHLRKKLLQALKECEVAIQNK